MRITALIAGLFLSMTSLAWSQMIIERGVGGNIRVTNPSMAIPQELSGQRNIPARMCGRETRPPPECGVNINTVDISILSQIPGFNMSSAAQVIAGRPYSRPSEIMERGIVPTMDWDEARNYLYVIKASLNYSTEQEIVDRTGLTPGQAQTIIRGRPWTSIDDLLFHGVARNFQEMERIRSLIILR